MRMAAGSSIWITLQPRSISAWSCALSPTLQGMLTALPPARLIPAATSSHGPALRLEITTLAPAAASGAATRGDKHKCVV